jgi:hypothetical protein
MFNDTKTVNGTVRKESIEIVKLSPEEAAVGGTGTAGLSGTSVISESSSGKETTIKGIAVCGKCYLHKTSVCRNVVQVKDGDKTVDYYLVKNDVTKKLHASICKNVGKLVTATGTYKEVDGKLEFTCTKFDAE